jgi:hypothetical protein
MGEQEEGLRRKQKVMYENAKKSADEQEMSRPKRVNTGWNSTGNTDQKYRQQLKDVADQTLEDRKKQQPAQDEENRKKQEESKQEMELLDRIILQILYASLPGLAHDYFFGTEKYVPVVPTRYLTDGNYPLTPVGLSPIGAPGIPVVGSPPLPAPIATPVGAPVGAPIFGIQ